MVAVGKFGIQRAGAYAALILFALTLFSIPVSAQNPVCDYDDYARPYMPAAEIPIPCCPRDWRSRWNFESGACHDDCE